MIREVLLKFGMTNVLRRWKPTDMGTWDFEKHSSLVQSKVCSFSPNIIDRSDEGLLTYSTSYFSILSYFPLVSYISPTPMIDWYWMLSQLNNQSLIAFLKESYLQSSTHEIRVVHCSHRCILVHCYDQKLLYYSLSFVKKDTLWISYTPVDPFINFRKQQQLQDYNLSPH